MINDNLQDPYVQKPTLTSDGKPWTQRCYICLKPVDFLKMLPWVEYVKVGQYARHKKCYPQEVK
jgi:hypothetical protein